MKKLLAMQDKDGAFTNQLGTIHALPALIGAVHYDVKDLSCPSKGMTLAFCSRNAMYFYHISLL